eukprot:757582-Hanusia_phi.AAC.4
MSRSMLGSSDSESETRPRAAPLPVTVPYRAVTVGLGSGRPPRCPITGAARLSGCRAPLGRADGDPGRAASGDPGPRPAQAGPRRPRRGPASKSECWPDDGGRARRKGCRADSGRKYARTFRRSIPLEGTYFEINFIVIQSLPEHLRFIPNFGNTDS